MAINPLCFRFCVAPEGPTPEELARLALTPRIYYNRGHGSGFT